MASYRPKKKLWEATRRITLPDGSKQRPSFYGKTAEEAEGAADAAVGKTPQGPFDRSCFSGFVLTTYLPTVQHLERNSKAQIAWALDTHLIPALGDKRLEDIDVATCQAIFNRKSRTLKPWTLKHIRKVLSAVMSLAEFDDLIRRNPVVRTKIPTPRKKELEFYTSSEMAALFEASRNTMLQGPVLMACFLGLRRGEALGADRKQIRQGSLEVRRQYLKDGGRLTFKEYLKNDHSRRDLPLPDGLREAVQELGAGSVLLCPNSEGGPINPDNIDRMLNPLMERAGLRRLTYHQLRHSFSANLELMGCPTVVRLALMGQSSQGTVRTLYTHANPAAKREWLGRLWDSRLQEVPPMAGGTECSEPLKAVGSI